MMVIACNAPFNQGGLGKFLAELIEQARGDQTLSHYFASSIKPNDPAGREIGLAGWRWLFRTPWLKRSLARRDYVFGELFDRTVARQLDRGQDFIGFAGRTLHSFTRARKLGYRRLILESPTSHIDNVRERHAAATAAHPFEESWLNQAQYRKTLREYQLADQILVSSEYAYQSFIQRGVAPEKVIRRHQRVEPRFTPPHRPHQSPGFKLVYTGRLQVSKGLPVLIETFGQWPEKDAELTLIGGCGSDAMEAYLKAQMARDPRIKLRPGDPLAYLHRADVLVHPSFEDGLGLGPMEALACGVPVIVTEDTGMKEYVTPGQNGYIVPTGSAQALVEHLHILRQNPLKGRFQPL